MSVEIYKQKFFNHVRELREQQGLSIAELAEQSGVSRRILEQLEQGILPKRMVVNDAYRLARVFQVEAYILFQ